ncbi:MAG: hypothetical protein JOZ78_17000 [Chroococcidiopsidaceae cyanobacterium CP_BM_ER_R8_30]|nr:hypothetical protein [Chroococcidiopsidaceae cyanobacterium CP_BM_ER_R8_30]
MTAAALGALTLDQCLKQQWRDSKSGLSGLALRFQKQLAKTNSVPWLMATGEDFRWPNTKGGRPDFATRLMHWYIDQVMELAGENAEAYRVFVEVMHLLKPPTALFQPSILVQILRLKMHWKTS